MSQVQQSLLHQLGIADGPSITGPETSPSGHEHDNPLTITMDANKIITAHFNSSQPTVLTKPVLNITSTSATLQGYINNTGGENCSVWFEYDYA